jgi:L-threonylcarbamoyladenylate synthase
LLISIDDAVAQLSKGNVVALPSETVYGLAGLALNEDAVRKIFALKGRPATNPLIVHVANLKQAKRLCEFHEIAKNAAESFWPGPLTLVLPKKKIVPDLVTAGNQTVAIRIPKHPVFLEILNKLGQPLAAPSANPSNRTSPTEAKHIQELFGENSPPIVDGGKSKVGLESTVLDLSGKKPTILRPGMVTRAEMESKLGTQVLLKNELKIGNEAKETANRSQPSPGMLPVHYAPKTPLYHHKDREKLIQSEYFKASDLVIVTNQEDIKFFQNQKVSILALAEDDCPKTIAKNLYRILIEGDRMGRQRMHILFAHPPKGINRATFDRILRASN